jgi:hypothetical protein
MIDARRGEVSSCNGKSLFIMEVVVAISIEGLIEGELIVLE